MKGGALAPTEIRRFGNKIRGVLFLQITGDERSESDVICKNKTTPKINTHRAQRGKK